MNTTEAILTGFVIGLFVGTCLGAIVFSLCRMAAADVEKGSSK